MVTRLCLCLLGSLCILPMQLYAQIGITPNTDTKTIEAVNENTAAIIAVEEAHNQVLEEVSKKAQAIASYASAMAAIKEAYRITMQNVDGFGQETQLYKAIAETAIEVVGDIPVAIREISKQPWSAVTTYREMIGLSTEAISAVNTFVNIVNNGTVSLKLKDLGTSGSDDGYNYLNRTDRYVLANSVLTRLTEIKYKLDAIIYMSQFCNRLQDVVYALSPDLWCGYFSMTNQVNTIVSLYKQL